MAQALKEVTRLLGAGLRQSVAVGSSHDAEQLGALRLEEVAEIFAEHHCDASEIAQGWHNAAGFKLRQKAGGKPRMAAQFDKTHLLALAKKFNALADTFALDEGFRGFRGNATFAVFGSIHVSRLRSRPLRMMSIPAVALSVCPLSGSESD